MNIKEWYIKTFPNDELGCEINEDATFEDLFYVLDRKRDVYEFLGDNIDSIIRERVFNKLAEIMGVDYNEVYEQWLLCD